jgi:hypothetical protein
MYSPVLPIVGKLRWHKHTEELAWAIRWTNPIMVELAKEARRKSLLDGARAFASEGKHQLHGSLIESLLLVKSLNELIKDRENPTVWWAMPYHLHYVTLLLLH